MDLFLDYGADLVLDQNGGMQTAVGWDETRQRILRDLCTNSQSILPDGSPVQPEYIYDTSYGRNFRVLVDQPIGAAYRSQLLQAVFAAVMVDVAVNSNVPPGIRLIRPDVRTLLVIISVPLQNQTVGTIALQVT